jgi:sugar phosphate isomerase/epimerase
MKLLLFQTLWSHPGTIEDAVAHAIEDGYDGIEGPPPTDNSTGERWRDLFLANGLHYVAEITTGCPPGVYVPTPDLTPRDHLHDFRQKFAAAARLRPLKVNCMAGSDLWSDEENRQLYAAIQREADIASVPLAFETHRSRATFHPRPTLQLLDDLPDLHLTLDFSHWFCVCEQPVLDTFPGLLDRCAARASHLHARVGYDQGPQVPHPAAPEYAPFLDAHLRWWRKLWTVQNARGLACTTATPEAGADGYLHTHPFTREPVADLREINRWMAQRLRLEFSSLFCKP